MSKSEAAAVTRSYNAKRTNADIIKKTMTIKQNI
jgi:hypothetical protein